MRFLGANNSKFKIQNLKFKIFEVVLLLKLGVNKVFGRKQFKIQNLKFKIFEVVLLLKLGVNEVFCTTNL
jgi:hypothetical protein